MRKSIEGDEQLGTQHPTSEVVKVARKISGTHEIDVRAGFEQVVRQSTENALTCYREASEARAKGETAEAQQLCEIADQALDLVRETLCKIEGL